MSDRTPPRAHIRITIVKVDVSGDTPQLVDELTIEHDAVSVTGEGPCQSSA